MAEIRAGTDWCLMVLDAQLVGQRSMSMQRYPPTTASRMIA